MNFLSIVKIQALSGNGIEFNAEETAHLFVALERLRELELKNAGSWADSVPRRAAA